MRDFYDIHTLYNLKKEEIDYTVLKAAINRTSTRRNSLELMAEYTEIIDDIKCDSYLKNYGNYILKKICILVI